MKLLLLCCFAAWLPAQTVQLLLKDGTRVEGAAKPMTIEAGGRKIPLRSIRSLHLGEEAAGEEARRIYAWLEQVSGADRAARDSAIDQLTAVGLAAMTPLLARLKDTDQHEPRPLYRLFARLVPPGLDQAKRDAALLRLANGEALRADIKPFAITLNGKSLDSAAIRRLAVEQRSVTREAVLDALQHSTQIEYLDTGIELSTASEVAVAASGFVRLAWNQDGWASDADGLKVPGPNYKTNLVDGHPFGAIVGRIGAGEVLRIGANYKAKSASAGRFRLAVNDNRHWQNNVGAFRVRITATNAYDLGDPQ